MSKELEETKKVKLAEKEVLLTQKAKYDKEVLRKIAAINDEKAIEDAKHLAFLAQKEAEIVTIDEKIKAENESEDDPTQTVEQERPVITEIKQRLAALEAKA